MTFGVELKPYDDTEEIKRRANSYIEHILIGASYFEHRLRIKPTVFMSGDVLWDIARGSRDAITSYYRGEPLTVCGYDLKMAYGEKVLYFGYELPQPSGMKGGE